MHLTAEQLNAGLAEVQQSPRDRGILKLIVVRPATKQRQLLATAQLSTRDGLVGDNWFTRPCSRTEDGSPHPDMQLTLMNSRVAALIAGGDSGWELAGDQLYVDFALDLEALPAGTRLSIGSSVVEVTDQPHTGCQKFIERFGLAAHKWVNSTVGRAHCLRGINAKVIQNGEISIDDIIVRVLSR